MLRARSTTVREPAAGGAGRLARRMSRAQEAKPNRQTASSLRSLRRGTANRAASERSSSALAAVPAARALTAGPVSAVAVGRRSVRCAPSCDGRASGPSPRRRMPIAARTLPFMRLSGFLVLFFRRGAVRRPVSALHAACQPGVMSNRSAAASAPCGRAPAEVTGFATSDTFWSAIRRRRLRRCCLLARDDGRRERKVAVVGRPVRNGAVRRRVTHGGSDVADLPALEPEPFTERVARHRPVTRVLVAIAELNRPASRRLGRAARRTRFRNQLCRAAPQRLGWCAGFE